MKWPIVKLHSQSSLPPPCQLQRTLCPSQCEPRKAPSWTLRFFWEVSVTQTHCWRVQGSGDKGTLCEEREAGTHPSPPLSPCLICLSPSLSGFHTGSSLSAFIHYCYYCRLFSVASQNITFKKRLGTPESVPKYNCSSRWLWHIRDMLATHASTIQFYVHWVILHLIHTMKNFKGKRKTCGS